MVEVSFISYHLVHFHFYKGLKDYCQSNHQVCVFVKKYNFTFQFNKSLRFVLNEVLKPSEFIF